jgi:hypothetical protein
VGGLGFFANAHRRIKLLFVASGRVNPHALQLMGVRLALHDLSPRITTLLTVLSTDKSPSFGY